MNRVALIIGVLGFWLIGMARLSSRPKPLPCDREDSRSTLLSSAVSPVSKVESPGGSPEAFPTPAPDSVPAPELEMKNSSNDDPAHSELSPTSEGRNAESHVLLSGPFPDE